MKVTRREASVVWTARDDGARLKAAGRRVFGRRQEKEGPAILIDADHEFQRIEGFGGAFTEAAAATFFKLPPAARREVLRAYFDPRRGHAYNLCRVHMNSCDFSLGNYACDETPGDTSLRRFNIDRDRQALLPFIQQAFRQAGGPFKLFLSPWSPPAWMKDTGRMNRGGKLRPEYRDAWARHYCRFIKAYRAAGVPLWGLTVQNEPMAVTPWDNCTYTAAEERDFVRDFLGPALHRSGLGRLKLMVHDHNRDHAYERASTVYADAKASRYVWGAAVHWYVQDGFDNLQYLHDAWPDKQILFSEGCQEQGPRHFGLWAVGERYARSIIRDLNRWVVGWVDWNLLLDETGGPNHVGNFCSAPLLADTRTGRVGYESSYWYTGHFSRFIRPGARRIVASSSRDDLETTAFVNPGGEVAVVVLNRTEFRQPYALNYRDGALDMTIPPRGIQTICFNA